MPRSSLLHTLTLGFLAALISVSGAAAQAEPIRIVLVAGETAKVDVPGHHDYLAGCECLRVLLSQTKGIEPVRVNEGWPEDTSVFQGAKSVVFYTDGGGKQAFLQSPERIQAVQDLMDQGVGVVMIHQAVDFPQEHADRAKSWLGGIYLAGASGRGHWPSHHFDFPQHAITQGVTNWKIKDGWLNGIQFVEGKQGVTPLVWSGKEYDESKPGIDEHIVAWAYARPAGGRSFAFTGLDAHSAWELPGMRQLVVNGILWSAGVNIPEKGAACEIDQAALDAMLTPREAKKK